MSWPRAARRIGPIARERVAVKLALALETEGEQTVHQLGAALQTGGKHVVKAEILLALEVLEQRGAVERVAAPGAGATWRRCP